jgi:hypothetical protein
MLRHCEFASRKWYVLSFGDRIGESETANRTMRSSSAACPFPSVRALSSTELSPFLSAAWESSFYPVVTLEPVVLSITSIGESPSYRPTF